MREHHYSDAILEAILSSSKPSLFGKAGVRNADVESGLDIVLERSLGQEPDYVPEWLTDRLKQLYAEVENEPIPDAFVILFRQMNGARNT